MGMFLNVLIVQNTKEEDVKKSLEKAGGVYPDWNLVPEECKYKECNSGVKVLLSDMCAGYEDIPKEISKELMCPAMLCYIYDGDYWGYDFYDSGREIDSFNPMPEYFEEVSEEEKQRLSGNSEIIARYFHIDEARIKNYLIPWDDDILDADESTKAYEEDEFCIGEDWQIADFMNAIGYSYDW